MSLVWNFFTILFTFPTSAISLIHHKISKVIVLLSVLSVLLPLFFYAKLYELLHDYSVPSGYDICLGLFTLICFLPPWHSSGIFIILRLFFASQVLDVLHRLLCLSYLTSMDQALFNLEFLDFLNYLHFTPLTKYQGL